MADNAKATASADLGYELVVRHAFMDYQIGDRISDAAKIQPLRTLCTSLAGFSRHPCITP